MDTIFVTKLIISFFVGGTVIAVLGWFAEKSNGRIAGIILSLPSTVVISYLFIGWTTSASTVVEITPATIASAGACQAFTVAYLYLSKIKIVKSLSILLSFAGALLAWLIIAVPAAWLKITDVFVALTIYAFLVVVVHHMIKNIVLVTPVLPVLKYTNLQKIFRGLFAGFIISLAVLLSRILNPFWGGILSSFPAVFTTTFLILHWYYGHGMLSKIIRTAPIGSIVYVSFVVAVRYVFPIFGIIIGTVIAYMFSLLIFYFLQHFRHSRNIDAATV